MKTLKNPKNGRNHLPDEDENALCGLASPECEMIEFEERTPTVCGLCKCVKDGGDLETNGPLIFQDEFGEPRIMSAERFIENMSPHFRSMVLKEHSRRTLAEFAIYWANDITLIEMRREAGTDIGLMLELEQMYEELFVSPEGS